MTERVLLLNDIDSVKKFIGQARLQSFDIDISSGKYTVNGKSIMGIFSLDLTKDVKMTAHCEEDNPFIDFVEQYISENK